MLALLIRWRCRLSQTIILSLSLSLFGLVGSNVSQQESYFFNPMGPTVAEAAYAAYTPSVTIPGSNQFRVEWTYNGDVAYGFKVVDVSANASGLPMSQAVTTYSSGKTNYYQVLSSINDGTYIIAIATVDQLGNQLGLSSAITMTMEELAAPTNFRGVATGSREILWTWEDNSYGETGFKIYDDSGDLVGRVEANKTSFRETGLSPDTYYERYVRAYKAADSISPAREGPESHPYEESTDIRGISSSGGTTDRSNIADAINDALGYSISSSDVVVVNKGDIEDEYDYQVQTEKNRYVAFSWDALDDYGNGLVKILTSDVQLKIPARWLRRGDDSGGTVVSLREYIDNGMPPAGRIRVGTAYEFDIIRYSNYSNNGYTLNNFSDDDPVYISFYYDYWRVSNPASLKVFTQEGGTWRELPSTVNTLDRAVQTRVEHFSRFALFEIPTGSQGIYPGASTIPVPGTQGYPGYSPQLPTPYGFPPGFGPGYGTGYESYQYNSNVYDPTSFYQNNNVATSNNGLNYGYSQLLFNDVINHWARPQIDYLASQGIISGTAPKIFEPDKFITRAEFLTLLTKTLNMQSSLPRIPPYMDVRANDWFAGSVQAGALHGVLKPADYFRPNEAISREEMAAWIGRSITGKVILGQGKNPSSLEDWEQVDKDLIYDIETAIRIGLIGGKPGNLLDPKGVSTRAEAAAVIYKLLSSVR